VCVWFCLLFYSLSYTHPSFIDIVSYYSLLLLSIYIYKQNNERTTIHHHRSIHFCIPLSEVSTAHSKTRKHLMRSILRRGRRGGLLLSKKKSSFSCKNHVVLKSSRSCQFSTIKVFQSNEEVVERMKVR